MDGLEPGQSLYLNQNPTINHNIGPKSTNYMSAKMDLDWQFSIH